MFYVHGEFGLWRRLSRMETEKICAEILAWTDPGLVDYTQFSKPTED